MSLDLTTLNRAAAALARAHATAKAGLATPGLTPEMRELLRVGVNQH